MPPTYNEQVAAIEQDCLNSTTDDPSFEKCLDEKTAALNAGQNWGNPDGNTSSGGFNLGILGADIAALFAKLGVGTPGGKPVTKPANTLPSKTVLGLEPAIGYCLIGVLVLGAAWGGYVLIKTSNRPVKAAA